MKQALRHLMKKISLRTRRQNRLTDLPNELILALPDLNALLQTSHFLAILLTPMIPGLAATSLVQGDIHRTVLHWAANHNRGLLMKLLLQHGAQVCIDILNPAGMTPLHSSIVLGYEEPVRILLDNRADTEITNRAGWTALMAAVITGNQVLSMLLLEDGADINSYGRSVGGVCSLHYATGLEHVDILHLLVQKGCDTLRLNTYKVNAVQTAASCAQSEVVEYLLKRGGFGTNDHITPWARDHSQAATACTKFSLRSMLDGEVDFRVWFARLAGDSGAVY